MIRILVVDDHEVVRTGLRALLGRYPEYEVVGEAAGGSEAIAVAIETNPDVVVLDYHNGLHVARKLRSRLPSTEILIFTMHYCEHLIEEAMRTGVRGYVLKSDASRDLIPAINAIAAHRPYFTDKVIDSLTFRLRNRRMSALRGQARRQSSRSGEVSII